MRPETAARQLEYVVASRLDEDSWSHWENTVYGEVFEYVYENGTNRDMAAVIDRIGAEVRDGYRPKPAQVRDYAATLCTERGRPLADGGEQ
ncbi:hypothetical protein [Halegenticoccus tardaugens]|uniref:hypothetical protein n=1 Tax=Halegenticoccus tardaugens TaxID=2071624 RepID=UPI00100AE416|nr:hypothetical protein [Halegenticoccus tardaugens]